MLKFTKTTPYIPDPLRMVSGIIETDWYPRQHCLEQQRALRRRSAEQK